MRVCDLGEADLLARMGPLLPRGPRTTVPTGDDAMVLDPSDGRVCVTTDVLVEGHHFRRGWSSAEQIGRRAVAQNLADVAGMGAVPLSIVVGLAVPAGTAVEWVVELARGLGEACRDAGAGVDGGDLSTSEQVVVAVTAFGDLQGRAPVLRSGARPGDVVAHVGDLGRSAAGWALAGHGAAQGGVASEGVAPGGMAPGDVAPGFVIENAAAQWALDGFRVPEPPLWAGPAAAEAGATALMDVSDGLLRDAGRLARASGVAINLQRAGRIDEAVQRLEFGLGGPGGAADAVDAFDPLTAVLTGGEDHGLLATFPATAILPAGWEPIGVVLEGPPGVVTLDGADPAEDGVQGLGWDHFGG